jgi:hypothetical protein
VKKVAEPLTLTLSRRGRGEKEKRVKEFLKKLPPHWRGRIEVGVKKLTTPLSSTLTGKIKVRGR